MTFFNCHSWLQRPLSSHTRPESRLRMSTAHHEWNHDLQGLVAMEKGFFREEGLEDIELCAFADDEDSQIEALSGGSVDIAMDTLVHKVLAAQDGGAEIYIVAPRRKMHSFVVVGQKGINSLEDLRGRTVHVGNEGEVTQQLRRLFKMSGLEWDVDVKIARRPNPHMHDIEGFRKSFVAGETLTVYVHPWEAEEWSRKGYPILADTTKLFPPRQDRVVTASGKFLQARPDALKGFLKAYIKASQFIVDRQHIEEIRGILERAGFLTDEADQRSFPKMMEGQWHRLSPDGTLPLEGIKQVITEQREAGHISDRVTLERSLRLEILYRAQRELGIEPQSN